MDMRTISIKIETLEVRARPRRLGEKRITVRKGKRKFVYTKVLRWSLESTQNLACHHKPDLEEHLEKQILEQACSF